VFFWMMDALVLALADDVDDAFPGLVRRLGDAVYSVGLRMCGPADAQDVAQDTFVRAYAALNRYEPERVRELCLRPWVLTIALNVARNRCRSASRHPQARLDGQGERGEPTAAEDTVDLRATLAAALLRLPVATRQAVVLRHVVGCDTAEAAAILDRPVGTVKSQVARGLATLRTQLEERE
jgi:RNA polymerase sigma-70 factor (ECF subfamily)